jgi:hypothetical protein
MSYGKLGVIKTIGERPTFCLLDKEGNPATIVPDMMEWLMRRVGKTVSLFISDAHFQVTDEDERIKL